MNYGIAFTPLVPSLVLWIALGAIVVIAALLLLSRARGAAVRVAALALILLALANPSFTREDREPLSSVAAVVIDNADRGTGDARTERALFHLYNLARETGGHLLLTSESAPAHWGIKLPDLRSRLMAAPAVAVGAPDDALLAAILVKLFADRQLRVGGDVIRFLVTHMERSFDAARRLVADLDAAALAARRRITVPLARRVLAKS